jgi:mono/diheme cytochrome c family protein
LIGGPFSCSACHAIRGYFTEDGGSSRRLERKLILRLAWIGG